MLISIGGISAVFPRRKNCQIWKYQRQCSFTLFSEFLLRRRSTLPWAKWCFQFVHLNISAWCHAKIQQGSSHVCIFEFTLQQSGHCGTVQDLLWADSQATEYPEIPRGLDCAKNPASGHGWACGLKATRTTDWSSRNAHWTTFILWREKKKWKNK